MTYLGCPVLVYLADRYGRLIAEVNAVVGPISWRLNKVGKVTIRFSRKDPKLTQTNLYLANRVLLRFDNGLPDWGGVIDFPETWEGDDMEMTAFSAEYLLALRVTGKNAVFTSATVGTIYDSIITTANNIFAIGVTVGEVWGGGSSHNQSYHYVSLLSVIQDQLTGRLSSAEFFVEPSLSNGTISFTAHLVEQRGQSKPNVALLEGHNATDISRARQGQVYNSVYMAGADTGADTNDSWGDGRLVAHTEDAASIDDIGLREVGFTRTDVDNLTTLGAEAETALQSVLKPKNTIVARAINLPPASFSSYDVGDTLTAQFHSYGFSGGFDGLVRVEGREFIPGNCTCDLLLREVV